MSVRIYYDEIGPATEFAKPQGKYTQVLMERIRAKKNNGRPGIQLQVISFHASILSHLAVFSPFPYNLQFLLHSTPCGPTSFTRDSPHLLSQEDDHYLARRMVPPRFFDPVARCSPNMVKLSAKSQNYFHAQSSGVENGSVTTVTFRVPRTEQISLGPTKI